MPPLEMLVSRLVITKEAIMTRTACYTAATALAALLTSGTCFAQTPPSTVLGTWTGWADQTQVKILIRSQGSVGVCRAITGVMANIAPPGGASNVQGFYCPTTGRISFLRKDTKTNDSFQSYLGSLAEIGGRLDRMAGTFSEVNFVGHMREFNFNVERSPQQ
jgi:hypothetical protein